jgi:hypothetical protein
MSNTSIPAWMLGATWDLVDPGNGGALDNAAWGTTRLVTAASETRTLPIPTKVGLKLVLVMETDNGDCVVTVGSPGYDESSSGNQTLTFSDPGQYAVLESMVYGTGTYAWRLTSYEGCTGPNTTLDDLTLATFTASGLVTMSAAATVGTTLAVTGTSTQAAINASALIAAAAAVTVGTTLDVSGTTGLVALNASGAVAAATTLDVVGTSTLNVTEVDGTLTIKDGGTVTQGTSTVTTVELNTNSGQIDTFASTLAAGGEESFTVTNSVVTALSTPIVCVASTSSAGTPHAYCSAVAAGSFVITVTNLHASLALDNDMIINFNIILGSSST